MSEEWRPVGEFPAFEVSDLGNVRRVGGRPKKRTMSRGYWVVGLWDGRQTNARAVHRLVCTAFHGPAPSERHQVAHRDGDSANARALNLRWATPLENTADKYEHGTHLQGDDCPWSKLSRDDVADIRRAPKRRGECDRLAKQYGVSKNHIAKIRTRSRGIWPDVPFPEAAHA